MIITIDSDTCTRCGICSEVCPVNLISPPDKSLPVLSPSAEKRCISCGQCVAFCPTGALTQDKQPEDNAIRAIEKGAVQPEVLGRYIKSRRSIRNFLPDRVDKKTITELLDITRFGASAKNLQPVAWHVIMKSASVREVSERTIDFFRSLAGTDHHLSRYASYFEKQNEDGDDPICLGAPHLLVAHIPDDNSFAPIDGIIALTHFDITAPAHGIGTCWAGLVMMAADESKVVRDSLGITPGRIPAYVMMFGYPRYRPSYIPDRYPATITWDD